MTAVAPVEPPQKAGSPLWWLNVLEQRLIRRQNHMLRLSDYYRGKHPLPFLTQSHDSKIKKEFRRLLEESRSNFMRLVVDTTDERMRVEGFRLSAQSDAVADQESWNIWQANQMDAQSQTAFLEALVKGVSYLGVWSDDDNDGYADICVEDPLETIVAYEPGSNYRRRAAALKVWLDDVNGVRRANVYLPDAIYKFQVASDVQPIEQATPMQQSQIPWDPMPDGEVSNPLGVVPIVPLRNRPRLLVEGESEISDVIAIQNQINGFLFLLALAGYFGAHRQRWVTGMEMFEDGDGKPREPFNTAVDRLWQAEDPGVSFGEFSQTDLSGYIKAIEQKVLHIAVNTRTPRHYLIEQGQSPSGDAIKSAESGLVQKVERKQRTFGEGLEEAMNLARRFQGETDTPPDSEVVWADPQSQTLGVLTDGILKQHLAGLIPISMSLEKLGYSQVEIAKIMQLRQADPNQFVDPNQQATASIDRALFTRNIPKGA